MTNLLPYVNHSVTLYFSNENNKQLSTRVEIGCSLCKIEQGIVEEVSYYNPKLSKVNEIFFREIDIWNTSGLKLLNYNY